MIEQLIAEATECDFKVALEIKKPKRCSRLFLGAARALLGSVPLPRSARQHRGQLRTAGEGGERERFPAAEKERKKNTK